MLLLAYWPAWSAAGVESESTKNLILQLVHF